MADDEDDGTSWLDELLDVNSELWRTPSGRSRWHEDGLASLWEETTGRRGVGDKWYGYLLVTLGVLVALWLADVAVRLLLRLAGPVARPVAVRRRSVQLLVYGAVGWLCWPETWRALTEPTQALTTLHASGDVVLLALPLVVVSTVYAALLLTPSLRDNDNDNCGTTLTEGAGSLTGVLLAALLLPLLLFLQPASLLLSAQLFAVAGVPAAVSSLLGLLGCPAAGRLLARWLATPLLAYATVLSYVHSRFVTDTLVGHMALTHTLTIAASTLIFTIHLINALSSL